MTHVSTFSTESLLNSTEVMRETTNNKKKMWDCAETFHIYI